MIGHTLQLTTYLKLAYKFEASLPVRIPGAYLALYFKYLQPGIF